MGDALKKEQPDLAFFEMSAEEAAQKLGSDIERGLTEDAARERLRRDGPNQLQEQKHTPAWRRFLAQFQDTLVILLLVAAAVSAIAWFVERSEALPYESIVILCIVLLNAVLGFIQEDRAEKALEGLRKLSAPEAKVVRDGREQRIPSSSVVRGDMVVLEEGDTVPADGRLVQAIELKTLEASLTGESIPASKSTQTIEFGAALGDRSNMVFSGTTIAYGHGRAIVTETGMSTEFGKIAGLLQQTQPEPTPLQRELDRTGKRLGLAVIIIALIVVATLLVIEGAYDARTMLKALLVGVALAVAAVPEGLAAIVTVVLALGVQRMARRGAIVRKLPAVETLGSATVIASDKTGTLTRNEMTVRAIATWSGRLNVGDQITAEGPAEIQRLLEGSILANNARLVTQDGISSIQGDPTEGALILAARKAGIEQDSLEKRCLRLREIPFSSERKMMSTINQHDGARVLWAKGAPDVLLNRCVFELVGNESTRLTDERRSEIRGVNETLAGEALRTLAVAYRTIPGEIDLEDDVSESLESDLVFIGLLGMIDPPRPEVAKAVELAKTAGIRPMMITGDHPGTALAIAKELGIQSGGRAATGSELERMDGSELASIVADVSVYARVNPGHKMNIVNALQSSGAVVAMTGDGVNDAPALKAADIGVAMGISGTDVSKDAADVVLTDDNFATIVAAVEEGRAIFANIRKFLRYLLSSNLGEVLTIFLGVVLAEAFGLRNEAGLIVPLLATQILWVNLITDGPPALALGVDPPEDGLMQRPPRPPQEHVITTEMWINVILVGVVMAVATLLVLDAALPGGLIHGNEDARYGRTMAFTTLVLSQLFNAFNARSDVHSVFSGKLNRWLVGAVLLSLALQILANHVFFFQEALETTALTLQGWMICALAASSVLWVVEAYKFCRRSLGVAQPT